MEITESQAFGMALCTTWFTLLLLLVGGSKLIRGYERLELRHEAFSQSLHESLACALKWAVRLHRPEAMPAYNPNQKEEAEKLRPEEREALAELLVK